MRYNVLIATILLSAALAGCGDVPVVEVRKQAGDTLRDQLIDANRHIANSEETQLDAYMERRGWHGERLGGGARVVEHRRGDGPAVEPDDTVAIAYRLEAINGRTFYDHEEDTVVAGRMRPTRGLDAALMALREGSHAHVLLPSEQGYGVAGDGDRVRSRMVLIYDVEVKKVYKHN